jgi:DNA invertase Pin-like site-specific DNA recombinase
VLAIGRSIGYLVSVLLVPYLRVSTDEQSTDSSGQLHAIRAWAAAHGHQLTEPQVDEGLSGSLGPDRRPGLARSLALVARSGKRRKPGQPDGVIAYDRTRLCRDSALCGWLTFTARSGGWRLLTTDGFDSADGSDAALFEGAMQGVFGELARKAIGRATSKALQARKSAGRVYGPIPFGQRRDGDLLVPAPQELATLARMRELAAIDPSPTAIARALNREGRLNRGRPWVRPTVTYLLNRKT